MLLYAFCCRAYDAAAFEDFKDAALRNIAAALGGCGAVAVLEKLLRSHPYSLAPHLLELLSSFPETLAPAAYLHLLPKVPAVNSSCNTLLSCVHANTARVHVSACSAKSRLCMLCRYRLPIRASRPGAQAEKPCMGDVCACGLPDQESSAEPQLPREPDWVESEATCAEMRAAGQYGALIATEHMARLFLGWRPPSGHQVPVLAQPAIAVASGTNGRHWVCSLAGRQPVWR